MRNISIIGCGGHARCVANTIFYNEKPGNTVANVKYDNAFGIATQIVADFNITKNFFLNIDSKYKSVFEYLLQLVLTPYMYKRYFDNLLDNH